MLRVLRPLDPGLLAQAIDCLIAQHDVLRMRFVQEHGQWKQIYADLKTNEVLSIISLQNLSEAEQKTMVEMKAEEAQSSLNLYAGSLMRVVCFDLGNDQPARILVVIHHLIVDGVSWRILLEDLQVAYEQFAHGQTLQLLPKTTSFQRWSQHLQSYAQEQKIRDEFSYRYRFLQRDIVPLPVDNEHGQNTVDSVQTITFALSQEETRALLYEVPRAYRTQINDVLLTAFAQTIALDKTRLYLLSSGRSWS